MQKKRRKPLKRKGNLRKRRKQRVLQPYEVRSRLMDEGFSILGWAIENNFHPRTVNYAINTWAGKRTSMRPKGQTAYILRRLEAFVEEPLFAPL